MRKNMKPSSSIYPECVLMIASYDENGNPDVMNAAWGGISGNNEIFMCLAPTHKTVKNICAKKEFTVSMGTADYVTACDYLGLASANDVPDKVARSGFHLSAAEHVDAPLIDELPLAVECRLKSYDEATHHLFAEIVNISVDESILDAEGNIDPEKLQAISFDSFNHTYMKVTGKVADAFSVGKKLMK